MLIPEGCISIQQYLCHFVCVFMGCCSVSQASRAGLALSDFVRHGGDFSICIDTWNSNKGPMYGMCVHVRDKPREVTKNKRLGSISSVGQFRREIMPLPPVQPTDELCPSRVLLSPVQDVYFPGASHR